MPSVSHGPDGQTVGELALEVSKGSLEGHSFVHKFGYATVGTSLQSVWDAGGLYPWPTAAAVLDIASDNINDTAAGTGARTLVVQGLDANWDILTETVTLNGTSTVQTTGQFLRVFRAYILTAGSGGEAAGTITIGHGATVLAQILNGNNQTLMAIYSVPRGYTAFLANGTVSCSQGKAIDLRFFTRDNTVVDSVFRIQHYSHAYQGSYNYLFPVMLKLTEKYDLDVRALAGGVGTETSAAFDVILIENSQLR